MRLSEPKTKTSSGILLPDNSVSRPVDGFVVAVGWSRIAQGHAVCVGDRVLLPKFGGHDIALDDVDHVVIAEDDIVGIMINPETNARYSAHRPQI